MDGSRVSNVVDENIGAIVVDEDVGMGCFACGGVNNMEGIDSSLDLFNFGGMIWSLVGTSRA